MITLKIHKHISGWPWSQAACCGSRINRCDPVEPLMPTEKYFDYEATHRQRRSCQCGKTAIYVEGQAVENHLHGCFLVEGRSCRGEEEIK